LRAVVTSPNKAQALARYENMGDCRICIMRQTRHMSICQRTAPDLAMAGRMHGGGPVTHVWVALGHLDGNLPRQVDLEIHAQGPHQIVVRRRARLNALRHTQQAMRTPHQV
jgi:hypothetical protein